MSGAFKVDSGVPLPALSKGGRGAPPKYPFGTMGPGDSFFVPVADAQRASHPVRRSANQYGKRCGMKFATRSVEGGIRCWRLA